MEVLNKTVDSGTRDLQEAFKNLRNISRTHPKSNCFAKLEQLALLYGVLPKSISPSCVGYIHTNKLRSLDS